MRFLSVSLLVMAVVSMLEKPKAGIFLGLLGNLCLLWSCRTAPRRLTLDAEAVHLHRWIWPKQSIRSFDIRWVWASGDSVDILHRHGLTGFTVGRGEAVAALIRRHSRPPAWGRAVLETMHRRQVRSGLAGCLLGLLFYLAMSRSLSGSLQGLTMAGTFVGIGFILASSAVRLFFSRPD